MFIKSDLGEVFIFFYIFFSSRIYSGVGDSLMAVNLPFWCGHVTTTALQTKSLDDWDSDEEEIFNKMLPKRKKVREANKDLTPEDDVLLGGFTICKNRPS